MALNRQQIREQKRHLVKAERVKRDAAQSLAELNEAERLFEQKKSNKDQMILQRGSLAVAIVSQIPERRPGTEEIQTKAVRFLDLMLDQAITVLTETDDEDDDDDDDDEENEDEPIAVVTHFGKAEEAVAS